MTRGLGTNAARINGPAPDPNSLRSAKRGAEWTRLPTNARDGKETPGWPTFVPEPTAEELTMWVQLWRKPQAVFWERDGMHNAVAMYVRTFIASMQPNGYVTEKTAAHRQSDALLLTTPALLAAKVLIVDPEPEQDEAATVSPIQPQGHATPRGQGVKGRFTIVVPSTGDVTEDPNESSTSDD